MKNVLKAMFFLLLCVSMVLAGRNELSLYTGAFNALQYSGLAGQGSQMVGYAYHFNKDWALGVDYGRVDFKTILEKTDAALAMKYRETINTNGNMFGLFLQKDLEVPLFWRKDVGRGYFKLGWNTILNATSELTNSEHDTLVRFVEKNQNSYAIQAWSADATLKTANLYSLTFGSELFHQKDFYVNMDMSVYFANLFYEYAITGQKRDLATSAITSLDETSQNSFWTSFFVVRFGASYFFSLDGLDKIFEEDTKQSENSASVSMPVPVSPKYNVIKTESGSFAIYELADQKTPLYIVKDAAMVERLPLPVEDIAQIESEINKTVQ